MSICVDGRATLEGTDCVVRLSGRADDAALAETSPLLLVQDLELVPLGRAMAGQRAPPPLLARAAAA